MLSIFSFNSQVYPPEPRFTEKDISSLNEKVYIITGSNTGIGLELAKVLLSKHAKIYIAARSKSKALSAIDDIKSSYPSSTGCPEFLPLDLADLSTIKASAQEFLSKEKRLDVLFNNAGVMNPPQGSKTAQGYELQLGTNCVVRSGIVWVSSSAAEGLSPKGGVDMQNLDYKVEKSGMTKYGTSKAGNYLHATEFTKRYREGIVSVPLNPGNLDSELYRSQGGVVRWILRRFVLYPPVYGAYTLLFAGLSEEATVEKSGDWVVPWGSFMSIRGDLVQASKSVTEGGTGIARAFWEWNEEQIKSYL